MKRKTQTFSSQILLLAATIFILFATCPGLASISLDFDDVKYSFSNGPTPPEIMVSWYIPLKNVDYKVESSPYFPPISQYSGSLNYTSKTLMIVWYFEGYDYLETGEQELCNYLEEHGELQRDTVDIAEKLVETGNDNTMFDPTNLNVTLYKSDETSGYFVVILNPFGCTEDNNYIIYYGTNRKPLEEQSETIKKLMAKSYYISNKNGTSRGLNYCISDKITEPINDSKTEGKNVNSMSLFGTMIIVFAACLLIGREWML